MLSRKAMTTNNRPINEERRALLARSVQTLAAAVTLTAGSARAQSAVSVYPSRPVRLVVPFAPGGPGDQLGRALAQQLQLIWKQPVIVDNRAGAGTIIGTDAVAKAPGDGYTMGLVVAGHTINPSLHDRLPFDTQRDLAGVTQLTSQQMVWVASPSAPFNNLAELIGYAKAHPQRVAFGSSGVGVATHLAGELLNQRAGIALTHVPYRGIAPAYADLLGGQIQLLCDVTSTALPYVKSNRLKLIAMTGPRRSPKYPEYPVMAETVPGLSVMSMFGLVMPSATPRPLVEKAHAAAVAAMEGADLRKLLDEGGMDMVGSTPEQFDRYIAAEIRSWAEIIKRGNIKAALR